MKSFVENIQDLKDNRDEIIDMIKGEAETEDMIIVKAIMNQLINIVTSSDYINLDIDIYETIEMAIKDVKSAKSLKIADISEINRTNVMKNLPSSMR